MDDLLGVGQHAMGDVGPLHADIIEAVEERLAEDKTSEGRRAHPRLQDPYGPAARRRLVHQHLDDLAEEGIFRNHDVLRGNIGSTRSAV